MRCQRLKKDSSKPRRQPRVKYWWNVFITDKAGPRFLRCTKAVSASAAVRNVWWTNVAYCGLDTSERVKGMRGLMFAKLLAIPPRRPQKKRRKPRDKRQLSLSF